MNYPILAAAIITGLAFLAHVFVGNREALSTNPARIAAADTPRLATVQRHWVQSMCAFQMVSVDLVALTALLIVLAATDAIGPERQVATAVSAFYALWGIVWLAQLLALRRGARDFLALGQWLLWLVCAGLVFWGARTA